MALRTGGRVEPGAYEPVSFSLRYAEPRVPCGYTSAGGQRPGELTVTVSERSSGVRGEIAGDVVCRPIQGEGGPGGVGSKDGYQR